MSLTDFVSQQDVQVILRDLFEWPNPAQIPYMPILAPPLTRNYALVGTAFDYLLRFCVENINKSSWDVQKETRWVADKVPGLLRHRADKQTQEQVKRILRAAKGNRYKFLKHNLEKDQFPDLLRSTILLAQLDRVYRSGYLPSDFGEVDSLDMEDLEHLANIIPRREFAARQDFRLNPTFGIGSVLVGGADADLILDSTLIDIKTTKYLELRAKYVAQLYGYYILSLIALESMPFPEIHELAIYYSRYGYLFKFPVRLRTLPDSIVDWFEERAKQYRADKFL